MKSVDGKVVGLEDEDLANTLPAPTGLEGEGTVQDAVRGAFFSFLISRLSCFSDHLHNLYILNVSSLNSLTSDYFRSIFPYLLSFHTIQSHSLTPIDLITTYHDLNPTTITTLNASPSPLEFMRYVARNQPFVIKNGAQDWTARKTWSATHLRTVLTDTHVNVAITPHGNADSIIRLPSGGSIFVKPHETSEPFADVIDAIQRQELGESSDTPTRYAQTQNDNLRNEYATLFADVPPSIPFARIALDAAPDAINFWLGNSHSSTALHKDNYENIYVQILGQKHFTLLPPIESACVNERSVLAGTYAPSTTSSTLQHIHDLHIAIDAPRTYTPFATWDPDEPLVNTTPYSQYSQPLRVTLGEGDMLYLPALWYHKVRQSCNAEGVCCAVNYWYDLDFGGGFWSMAGFVRGVGLLSMGEGKKSDGEDERGEDISTQMKDYD
ncbi:Clavaminate synthase-like protein [Ophiobolus disseminans]|uniref:Clavaminate synthase-like protein n=1 Tax=Ophiobolus disseminans TaxID=1469910 RepID=A0A6A6ZPW4_9PLEO|nr:Clavaminate synthase-like protein [Ophiobolus disseminans]